MDYTMSFVHLFKKNINLRKFKQHVKYYNLLKFFSGHNSYGQITTSQIVLGNLQITFHPLLGTLQFLPIVCRVQRLLWTLPYIDYCGQGIIIFLLHLTLMYTGIVLASQQTNQFTRNDFEKLPLASGWCYHINKRETGVQLSFPVRLKHRVYYK